MFVTSKDKKDTDEKGKKGAYETETFSSVTLEVDKVDEPNESRDPNILRVGHPPFLVGPHE